MAASSAGTNPEEEKKVWQVAELQQELEHFQRRCQSLELRVANLQQQLVAARQAEDVLLKDMEVKSALRVCVAHHFRVTSSSLQRP